MFDKHPHQEGSDSGDLQLKYNMNVKVFEMENQPTFPMRMTKDPSNVACQHSEEAALKEQRVNI